MRALHFEEMIQRRKEKETSVDKSFIDQEQVQVFFLHMRQIVLLLFLKIRTELNTKKGKTGILHATSLFFYSSSSSSARFEGITPTFLLQLLCASNCEYVREAGGVGI